MCTAFTQEVIMRLLQTRKQQSCVRKQIKFSDSQILKISGYSTQFGKEILKSGIAGFDKILEDDKNEINSIYRSEDWKKVAKRMEKKNKNRSWLDS